jgi:hypothetical protein
LFSGADYFYSQDKVEAKDGKKKTVNNLPNSGRTSNILPSSIANMQDIIIDVNNLEEPSINEALKSVKSDEVRLKKFKDLIEYYKIN